MANGVLGLGSGQASTLNSDLIDKLKTAERKSTVEPIETKITKIATEKETFSSVQKKVTALLDAVKPFDLFISGGVTAFEQKTATTSGDSATFDAADVKSLNKGFTTVDVTQLAQKDVYQSNAVNATTKNATMTSLGDLTISAGGVSSTFITEGKTYQQLADEKSLLSSVDKNDKSTFEKNNTTDTANNKNTQRDEESKKTENMISSVPNLDNAREELSKNGNLNKLFLQNQQQGVNYDS